MARVARALGRYIDGTSWPFHALAAWVALGYLWSASIDAGWWVFS